MFIGIPEGDLKVFWGGSMTEALGAWVLLYWWLCEARVAATRMAKLRVDGSQLFGVALRANQFLPKRGFMDYQRLPSRVAMLPVSSFGSFQAIKHFVNMVMSVVQLGLFFFLSCVALDLYFFYVTCVLCNFCRKENLVYPKKKKDVEEKTMMVAWKKRDGVVRPATTVAFYKKIREEKDKMEKKRDRISYRNRKKQRRLEEKKSEWTVVSFF